MGPIKVWRTPLWNAVKEDNVEVVRLLLDAGAEQVDTKDIRQNMWDEMIVKSVCRVRSNVIMGFWVRSICSFLARVISFSLHIFESTLTTMHPKLAR